MKQYFYIGNIKNTFTRRFVLCLCVLPWIFFLMMLACLAGIIEGFLLMMLACLAGIIEGLEEFYQSAKEFSFDMFRVCQLPLLNQRFRRGL